MAIGCGFQLGCPSSRPSNSGASVFDQDAGFEIQPRRESEIFMVRPCKTIHAAMLTTPVGIDAGVETDVGAVVGGDNGSGVIFKEFGGRTGILTRPQFLLIGQSLKAIARILASPPPRMTPSDFAFIAHSLIRGHRSSPQE